jgi:hypothetical protein
MLGLRDGLIDPEGDAEGLILGLIEIDILGDKLGDIEGL